MNKKSSYLLYAFFIAFVVIISEVIYLNYTKSITGEVHNKKVAFVKLTTLPDLAISTQSYMIRHRSLSTISDIYNDDGSLREYTLSSYAINHSTIINPHVLKATNEK